MDKEAIEKFDAARRAMLLAIEQMQNAQEFLRDARALSNVNLPHIQRLLRINIDRLNAASNVLLQWTL